MSGRGIDPTLRRSIERGEYVVNSRAVAEAILRSGVFVSAQPGDGTAGREENEPVSD
jgi:hypothetical protein